jgi:transposase
VDYWARKVFGKRSEKESAANSKQGELFNEAEKTVSEESEEEKETITYTRTKRKPGRKPLSDKLPRRVVVIEPGEQEKICPCCGKPLVRLAEENDDVTEKLEYTPAKMEVLQERRPKYVCPDCRGTDMDSPKIIREAPATPSMIPGSIVTPMLLAVIIVMKYLDGMPYYRQEGQFKRLGAEISRQDMSNWQIAAGRKLKPLLLLLKLALREGKVLRMDETTTEVFGEEGRANTSKSYMAGKRRTARSPGIYL